MNQPIPDPGASPPAPSAPSANEPPSSDATPSANAASTAGARHPITEAAPDPGLGAARRRRSLIQLAVAVFSLAALAGSAFVAGFGTGFAVGRPDAGRYEITVFLEKGATENEKAPIRAALQRLDLTGEVRLKTSAEAAADAQQKFRDQPELLENMTAENLPESFEAVVTSRTFTCAGIDPIWKLAAVDELAVIRRPVGDQPGARMGC